MQPLIKRRNIAKYTLKSGKVRSHCDHPSWHLYGSLLALPASVTRRWGIVPWHHERQQKILRPGPVDKRRPDSPLCMLDDGYADAIARGEWR
ncbi:hypothetical protein BG74_02125 [Sodalis-like endosymbiont of Proechinophthirus fluctus]|uniref:hypothetical protein n=1 Tax=Sodalis-like endosymbiont of Proechinophthirus fluctus TaxID=1462730 RepID=UPI0007A92087|nr:hypothetical protein [Sodalis-like endosymbiont of Proechinophthirus fluctus]KYP97544.1 hypothetical protein BG74_02125 [Sodalis-like endosymbiont of Proechinophthirus fluctus]